jgi:hypothetical protein
MIDVDAARDFMHREARVVDRRLFARLFDDGPAQGVLDAVLAYRNDDGGFGHGLEPDKLSPHSQPLDTEMAFEIMDLGGCVDGAVVDRACDFLAAAADGAGLVPLAFENMVSSPHAAHWNEIPLAPDINPTAGIAALLWKWDVDHPYRQAATAGCWKAIEHEIPGEVHAVKEALLFLEHQPDRGRAEALAPAIAARLLELSLFQAEPGSTDYGLTPLDLAPLPSSPWRRLFDAARIEAFLDDLEGRQQDDGGWPIAWEPPSRAAVFDWRGWVTIRALVVLRAAGRLPS